MAKNIKLTEDNAKKSPQGGVLVGKKDGQTIIYDDGKVGGWFVGKTHKEGGIQGIDKTTGQPIEVQTGEVIITAPALADQTPREFQGKMLTNRQILSKINSDAGGVAFAEDGMEIPSKILFKGGSYKYGGKMMSDKEIADEINKCGCDHDEKYDEGGNIMSKKEKQEVINSRNSIYEIPQFKLSNDGKNVLKLDARTNRYKTYDSFDAFFNSIKNIKASSIANENSKKVFDYLEKNGAELYNKSIYGSRYYDYKGKNIRVSNHYNQSELTDEYSVKKHKEIKSFFSDEEDGWKEMINEIENFINKEKFNNGGHLSEGMSLEDIAKKHGVTLEELDKQVEIGMEDESIHAGDYKDHFNIVKDHLAESPTFYTDEQKAQGKNEKFVKGGEMKKENLVKDAKDGNTPARDLNNYNDMLDVQADGQVGGDSGIYEDGGGVGKVITPIVSNWNDVPSTWKNTTKVKKVTWANNPYDKGLYSIVAPFLGHDDLRPIFEGINFDENGITCTDTHKLITLPYPNKEYNGTYNSDLSKKKDSEQITIDGKYPNYVAIIPKIDTKPFLIDVYKLLQYTQVASKYANKITHQIVYKIDGDNKIAFNGKFLIEVLNTLLKLGHEKVYAHYLSKSNALTLSAKKEYLIGNDEIFLIMPVMIMDYSFGAKDIEYGRELSVYYDFNDNEIHNSDGSVAEFKMNYESNSVLSLGDVKPFETMIKKTNGKLVPILDYVLVKNGVARTSNLESEYELKGVNLPDGIYKANNGILEITMEAIEDYPQPPIFEVDENTIQFVIPSTVFEYYIDKLKFVVGKDELRPVMMGICLHHTSDNKLFLASTDATILLKVDITQYVDMPIYNKDIKTIIQPNLLYEFLNTIDESELHIKANKVATKIDSDKWSFYCRNIDGNFPNVDAVIPRESNKLLTIDLNELRNCLDSDFAKKYEKESSNKDGIFVFNHEHEVYVGTYDRYARENKKEKIEKLCTANISVKEESYYYNDQSILLIMPVMTDDEKVDFSFGKKILQRVISIVSDKKLEMHYSALNRAYLVPINSFDYKKTTKEHKVKEQPAKLKEVKKQKENSEKTELLEAIETLNMLGELEQDEKERKEIYEALDVLNMIKESNNYENGGMMKRDFSFTPIQTPLN